MSIRSLACALFAVVLAWPTLSAQGTAADYARSDSLRSRVQGLPVDIPGTPTWIGNTDRFWYRKTVAGGSQFVLVDATTKEKRPAFDHARLAAALSSVAGKPYIATTLPFTSFTFGAGEQSIDMNADSTGWHCTLTDYQCAKSGGAPGGGRGGRGGAGAAGNGPPTVDQPRMSPDGKSEAVIRNYNIFIRAAGSKEEWPLSFDGSEGNPYQARSIVWAPDSKKLAAYRVKPGYRRMVRYVQSSPPDQVQPKTFERFYAKPGDVLDLQQPSIFEVASKHEMVVDNALFPNAYALSRLEWRRDGRAVVFEYNQRGHQVFRVIEVNATTGAPRARDRGADADLLRVFGEEIPVRHQ